MPKSRYSDAEFIEAWKRCSGSATAVSKALNVDIRGVHSRRQRLAKKGVHLDTLIGTMGPKSGPYARALPPNPARIEIGIPNGVVLVASDCHYWPDRITVGHRAFVALTRQLKPVAVVANGDVLDGARISRHDRNGWTQEPRVPDEFNAARERLGEIEDAAGLDCGLYWTLGNHDMRFERYLAMNAPEFQGMPGSTLPEHFPRWQFSMSLLINPESWHPVMVKHRHANGVHAAYNNALKGGITLVTGHLHRLIVTPWGDYRGRRYGIDTGTLAEIGGPQFGYAEDGPHPGAQGFAVLTFHDGELAPPELVEVRGDHAFFRGRPIEF